MQVTIADLNSLKLNYKAADEFNAFEGNGLSKAIECISDKFHDLRNQNGRKIRSERREAMFNVLTILYSFVQRYRQDNYGECSPSMRTIAYRLDNSLEQPSEQDAPYMAAFKERRLMSVVMTVHRAIHALVDTGFIRIHKYRAETNQNENDNFYYEIVPVSLLSSVFAAFVKVALSPILKVSAYIYKLKTWIMRIAPLAAQVYEDDSFNKFTHKETNWERDFKLTGLDIRCLSPDLE